MQNDFKSHAISQDTKCPTGRAVQIISNQCGKFVLDENTLKDILLHPVSLDKPIYIISIVGSFRTGKSFC